MTMNHSIRLRTSVLAASVLLMLAFLPVRPALADTPCPANGPEQGGTRTCFDTSSGHVYVWKPAKYDPATAITVIHVHGYHTGGEEDNTSNHFVDEVWRNHGLARKFNKSGLNALFIAPEGFVNNGEGRHWDSLDGLLSAVASHGDTPPATVVVEAHSGGGFSLMRWTGSSRLKQAILLDCLYNGVPQAMLPWYKAGGKITIVNSTTPAPFTNSFTTDIGPELVRHTGMPASFDQLTDTEKNARALFFDVHASIAHAALVDADAVIPVVLQRANTSGTAPAPSGGNGIKEVRTPFVGIKPVLSIPIPNLSFSEITVTETGEKRIIDIPFLAEYLAAVYKFGVAIASIIAAVMMMIGGFRWMTAGGNTSSVSAAKDMIKNALIGLALSLGTYALLYAVNPDLVTLKGTQVQVVSRKVLSFQDLDEGDAIPTNELSASTPTTPAAGGPGCSPKVPVCGGGACGNASGVADCKTLCDSGQANWPKCNAKTIDVGSTILIPKSVGIVPNGKRATAAVVSALAKAGEIADSKGYFISVGDGFRDLTSQIQKVCDKITSHAPPHDIGCIVAWPGGSNHGAGYAVDITLFDKTTKDALFVSTKCGQCDTSKLAGVNTFVDIMTQAGFYRYVAEAWHWEFGGPVSSRVCKGTCPTPTPCTDGSCK